MHQPYFKSVEQLSKDTSLPLREVVDQLTFNDQGLMPVITQDATSKAVLMFAWMNREALSKTIRTGYMTYWSRSRNSIWLKGETSGHKQTVESITIDCDGDVILCKVHQVGVACHTGRESCFYLEVDRENNQVFVKGAVN